MSFALAPLVQLGLLCLSYWALDRITRQGGALRLVDALDAKLRGLGRGLGLLALVALGWWWRWDLVLASEFARPLGVGLGAMLTWKVVTKDLDIAAPERHVVVPRLALLAAVCVAWWSPAGLVLALVLLTRPFEQWRHHAILPMRLVLALVAHTALSPLAAFEPLSTYVPAGPSVVFFVLTVQASHYLSAGWAKLRLGPRWSSWMLDNRLHHQVANAWGLGWARFMPWPRWHRLVRAVARVERPLQAATVAIELFAPLALLSPSAAYFAFALWSLFHLGALLLGGFLFWDWIGTSVMLGLALALAPASLFAGAFGWQAVLISTAFIVAFPLRNRLWGPILLAWWETPSCQRMRWFVEGESGRRYELHADFMCPHERLYAKVQALFLAPVPLMSFHLGTVWEVEHRDALREAGPDPRRLDEVRARFGVQPRDPVLAADHVAYLHRFLAALARGARKHVLPPGLRWLKAPGGHCYYWGELPAFRGQEPARRLSLRFDEHYYDGEALVQIHDDEVLELVIDERSSERAGGPEPRARSVERAICEAFWARAQARSETESASRRAVFTIAPEADDEATSALEGAA